MDGYPCKPVNWPTSVIQRTLLELKYDTGSDKLFKQKRFTAEKRDATAQEELETMPRMMSLVAYSRLSPM